MAKHNNLKTKTQHNSSAVKSNKMQFVRNIFIFLGFTILVFFAGFQTGSRSSITFSATDKSLNVSLNGNDGGITIDRFVSNQKNPDFNLFWQVWDKLKTQYIDHEELQEKEMLFSAIKGLVNVTDDPYTVFLTPDENKRAKDDLSGAFEGVGIQLGFREYLGVNRLAVITPIEGNPAIKAGVKAGDIIVKIDGEDTKDMSLPDAVDRIRGEKGTDVNLALFTEGDSDIHEVSITRGTISVPSVSMTWLNQESSDYVTDNSLYAHLRVSRFGEQTTKEWNEKIKEINQRKKEAGFKGILLDLRGNPGGFFKGAIELGSDLVESGVIVQQEDYNGNREQFRANGSARLVDIPLVILVNKGSASASEILAGAVRDLRGTKLVGDKTFGKGSVQEAIDMDYNTGLHITTYRWLLPSGQWIHHEGIPVDIEVKLDPDKPEIDEQLQKAIEEL